MKKQQPTVELETKAEPEDRPRMPVDTARWLLSLLSTLEKRLNEQEEREREEAA